MPSPIPALLAADIHDAVRDFGRPPVCLSAGNSGDKRQAKTVWLSQRFEPRQEVLDERRTHHPHGTTRMPDTLHERILYLLRGQTLPLETE